MAADPPPPSRTAVIFASSQVEMDAVLAHLGYYKFGPSPFVEGQFEDWRVAVLNVEQCDEDTGLVVERLSRSVSLSISGSLTGSVTAPVVASQHGAVSVERLLEMAWEAYRPEIAVSVGAATAGNKTVTGGDVVIADLFATDNGGNYGSNVATWTDIKAVVETGSWRRRGGGPVAKAVLGTIAGARRKAPKGGKADKRFRDALAFEVPGTAFWHSPVSSPLSELLFIRGILGESYRHQIGAAASHAYARTGYRAARKAAAASAAAFAMEFLAHRSRASDPIEMLRTALLDFAPDDFEWAVGAGLSGMLGEPFRQASSGRQPSGDVGGGTVRVEAKRYRKKAPETRDLLGSLTSTLNAVPDLSHWVVASTIGLPLQAIDDLHLAARRQGVKEVVLDWPSTGVPPLAAALVLGRAEVARSFKSLGPILEALADRPEIVEAGRKVLDTLRRDPPGRPIHDPVLRYVAGKVNAAAALDPAYRVVKFMNREREMADWLAWARDGNLPARLLTGAGGMGKTRLLIELCEQLRREGWRTGFLKEEADYDGLCRQLVGREKWLIVVDYAERRPHDLDSLCRAVRDSGAMVRLALLARRDGEWLENLVAGRGATAQFLDGGEGIACLQLEPVKPVRAADRLYTRQAIYEHAIKDYVKASGGRRTKSAYRALDFDDIEYDNILLLLLEAWAVAFDGSGRTPIQAVLDREKHYLEKLAPSGLSPRTMMEVLAWIYAHGPASIRKDAIALLSRCPALEGQNAAMISQVAEVFHDVYPGPHWLNRIQPDLIGEEVVKKYGLWNP